MKEVCPGAPQAATQGRQDSPLALQGQGRVNPLPDEGPRLGNQRLRALEAAGAMPKGSPGLLLPAGRGAAVPQPLRWTCKTHTCHSRRRGQADRLGSQLSPPWGEPAERDRTTSLRAGSPHAALCPCSKQGQGSSWIAAHCSAPGQTRLGAHHARTGVLAAPKPLGRFSREVSKAQRGFANAARDSAVAA